MSESRKCLVSGCQNHEGEGTFIGELCAPCHQMLLTGVVRFGTTFVHALRGDSCLQKLQPGEPYFVLRGQDMFAGVCVFLWCTLVEFFGDESSAAKLSSAKHTARNMLRWPSKKIPD